MKELNAFFLILHYSPSTNTFFMRIEKKRIGGISVGSSNSVFGWSGNYPGVVKHVILKDSVLMSKNGLSMENISHARVSLVYQTWHFPSENWM